ncbi:hypothetical protein BB560_000578 [Smittium megazygosporum]|uniref:Pentatricopeptide repeat-containing protein-mitochondrial domain-containing protein n=1 Tax=Smittium megazygosporum TaxID=133381 RepID=A0A2T9ZJV7_9FUNG|nr:hypothetical protein BB560_000578 [Smittium megazygosporum]
MLRNCNWCLKGKNPFTKPIQIKFVSSTSHIKGATLYKIEDFRSEDNQTSKTQIKNINGIFKEARSKHPAAQKDQKDKSFRHKDPYNFSYSFPLSGVATGQNSFFSNFIDSYQNEIEAEYNNQYGLHFSLNSTTYKPGNKRLIGRLRKPIKRLEQLSKVSDLTSRYSKDIDIPNKNSHHALAQQFDEATSRSIVLSVVKRPVNYKAVRQETLDPKYIWKIFSKISSHEDKYTILRQISDHGINILIRLLLCIENDYSSISNEEKVIQIISDLVSAGRKINSYFHLASFFLCLNSQKRFNDTVSLFSSLSIHKNNLNNKPHETTIESGSEPSSFVERFCKSFEDANISILALNHLIHAYIRLRDVESALSIYNSIPDFHCATGKIFKNTYTYFLIFEAALEFQAKKRYNPNNDSQIPSGKDVFEHMINDFAKAQSKKKDISCLKLNPKLISSMLCISTKFEHWGLTNIILSRFKDLGVYPDYSTLEVLVKSLAKYNIPSNSSFEDKENNIFSASNKIDKHTARSVSTNLYDIYFSIYKSQKGGLDATFSDSFIKALVRFDNNDLALKIYSFMNNERKKHTRPTITTFEALLAGFARGGDLNRALLCFSELQTNHKLEQSPKTLFCMYKCLTFANFEHAKANVEKILKLNMHPSITPFNIMIAGHASREDLASALNLYKLIPSSPFLGPNIMTFYMLFNIYFKFVKKASRGISRGLPTKYRTVFTMNLLNKNKELGPNPSTDFGSNIPDDPIHPRQLLNYIIYNNIHLCTAIYNVIIPTFIGLGDTHGAEIAYNHMTQVQGFTPNEYTYFLSIQMYVRTLNFASTDSLLDSVISKISTGEFHANLLMYNSLIINSLRVGYINVGVKIYSYMVGRSVDLCQTREPIPEESNEIPVKVDRSEIFNVRTTPDLDTFLTLIQFLFEEDRISEALEVFEDMEFFVIQPSVELLLLTITNLYQKKYYKEAREIKFKYSINLSSFGFEIPN